MATTSGTDTPDAASLFYRVTAGLANHKAVFAIGGTVDVSIPAESAGQQAPLVIRWDSGGLTQARKVAFPVGSDAASTDAFGRLQEDCEPVTFGHGTDEVLDETYRKARKLGAAQFSTSFSPYEHGIMDTVTQTLVHRDYRGIQAELYNFNIYSGPSGKFKPRVDTKRSKEQMGSLVVCLPHPHQGGQMAVRHRGRQVVFDWASAIEKSPSTVQWAAFFSDCEHEVMEVTDGHRLTLTYNLYWTPQGPASMADNLGAFDPESLTFFSPLQGLVECPQFLAKGGRVGFICTHAYPHTSKSHGENLHKSLKGLDMVVYQALMTLVGSAQVVSVLDDEKYQTSLEERGYWRSDTDKALIGPLPATPVLTDEYGEDDEPVDPEKLMCKVYVNNKWRSEAAYTRHNVTWLNNAPHANSSKEFAAAFITCGNAPSLGAYYSSAAIIAKLWPWDEESGSRKRAVKTEK